MSISRITSLTLQAFRNYAYCEITCDAPLVILSGENGTGKTNLLEAISLLSPGRGFRNSPATEQLRHGDTASQWIIRTEHKDRQNSRQIATASNPEQPTGRRVIHLDGDPLPRQQDLLEYLLILWFLPSMSHLFQEGMSARRKYMDRIVYGFDAHHASRIHAYDHYMRERRQLLRFPTPDIGWLHGLETKMAEYAVAIASARLDMVARINQAFEHIDPVFPHARLSVTGHAETALQNSCTALEAEEQLLAALETSRPEDAQNGRCAAGAHKTGFEVTFLPHGRAAEHCSTGEQKALLLSLLLAQIHAHTQWSTRPPIVLLDEMVAHLDTGRRSALFTVLQESGVQVFATGTDAADFDAARTLDARFLHVENGQVCAV